MDDHQLYFVLDLPMLKLVEDVISEGCTGSNGYRVALLLWVLRTWGLKMWVGTMRTCRCVLTHFTASKPMIKPWDLFTLWKRNSIFSNPDCFWVSIIYTTLKIKMNQKNHPLEIPNIIFYAHPPWLWVQNRSFSQGVSHANNVFSRGLLRQKMETIQVHGRLRTDPDALTLLSGVSLEEGDVGADQNTEVTMGRFVFGLGGVMKRQNYKIAPLPGISTGLIRTISYNSTNRGL